MPVSSEYISHFVSSIFRFLQENYPGEGTTLRYRLFGVLGSKEGLFEEMCKDVFGNFFVQRMIDRSTLQEQILIAQWMSKSMFSLCMNRYSCRVIQKAIEVGISF